MYIQVYMCVHMSASNLLHPLHNMLNEMHTNLCLFVCATYVHVVHRSRGMSGC